MKDGTWKVQSPAPFENERFGRDVVLLDDLMLVGSINGVTWPEGVDGQAVLFQFIDGDWQPIRIFNEGADETFGWSVDMDADRIVISSPYEQGNIGNNNGAVYVYDRIEDATWELDGVIYAGAGNSSPAFGNDLALDGSFLAIGEPYHDAASGGVGAEGRVQIWRLGPNGAYAQLQAIEPTIAQSGRMFGYSVALEGDTLVVGGPSNYFNGIEDGGRAWIFQKDGDFYEQEIRLEPTSPINSRDLFGISVAIDANRVAVGSPGRHVNGMERNGSVQLHINDGTGWTLEDELMAEDVFGILDFGMSVVLEGSRLAVGMPTDSQSGQRAGALVLFERQKAGWAQIARMVASDGQTEDQLGSRVGMSGNRVAGCAPRYGQFAGSVYIYDEDGGWQDEPGYAIVPTLFAGRISRFFSSRGARCLRVPGRPRWRLGCRGLVDRGSRGAGDLHPSPGRWGLGSDPDRAPRLPGVERERLSLCQPGGGPGQRHRRIPERVDSRPVRRLRGPVRSWK